MKRFIKDNTYHIVYENLNEFFELTNPKNPAPATMNKLNKDQFDDLKGDTSWRYGDEDNQKTFHEVRFDSKKGKDLCSDAVKKTMASKEYRALIKQALTYRKRIKYVDHGFRLNISKAISGEDKCFGVYTSAHRPVVKIAINICGSACVGQEEFINVAKTAIPTIYALETAGIATEVYYCAFAKNTHEDDAEYTGTHVRIKSSQQRFNWTTFAPVFTLGSYRESIFASWITSEHKVHHGLGQPMSDRDLKRKDNYGYTSVIGLNAAGPVKEVKEVFSKINKKGV
jgi:hypothetical protein